jgi:sec-independent protein translocase protein TatC
VLTPPDVVSQLLLAIPLCILYELAIIAIWLTHRGKTKTAPEVSEAAAE